MPMLDTPGALVAPEQRVRAAWLDYAEGMTQAQIARTMQLSRVKVIALLAAARDAGLVSIRVNAKAAAQLELERRLVDRFSLHAAIVVPSPAREIDVARVVGHAAGVYLGDQLRDGMSIGIGWGERCIRA